LKNIADNNLTRRNIMSAASDFTENLALNWLLTSGAATRPTAWYLGLHTASPLDDDSGANEISGGSYARQSIAFTVALDTASNSATITFPAATATWGTISHISVYDASTGGNLLFHGAVTTSKTIESGDTFQVSASNLTITLA
jgi:hypothetical protein